MPIRGETIGRFQVQNIDPKVAYVTDFGDSPAASGSLRSAINAANDNPDTQHIIILEPGNDSLQQLHTPVAGLTFGPGEGLHSCGTADAGDNWSGAGDGNLDVFANVIIAGDSDATRVIDAAGK